MKSFRQKIQDEKSRLIEAQEEFIQANRDAFTRYNSLAPLIHEREQRAIQLAEEHKRTLISLINALPANILSDKNNTCFTQIQAQIALSEEHLDKSRLELNQLNGEYNQLKQFIEPFFIKHNQAISELEQKDEAFIASAVRNSATLWKHNASRPRLYFNAIENNDFPGLQNLYRPTLANRFNHDGFTPLILAINKNHSDMVRWLLTKEDVNPETPVTLDESFKGITPLCAAIIWENPDEKSLQGNGATGILAALIARGACINKPSTTNLFTPLHWAAFSGSKECIKFLLENNADITVLDNNGNTPLAIFTQRHPKASHFKSIKELFNARAKSDKPASRRKWF